MKISLMPLIAFCTLVSAGPFGWMSALAYNSEHGPLESDQAPDYLAISQLTASTTTESIDELHEYRYDISGESNLQLWVWGEAEHGFAVQVTRNGQRALEKTQITDWAFLPGLETYCGDLNRDGRSDFIVYAYSGGCGLAVGYCDVTFLLSAGETYTARTVTTLFPDKSDYVLIAGKPCFIVTDFMGEEHCLDGKGHNFWIYNLLVIDGSTMRLENEIDPSFPRIIWYSFAPNHKETTLLHETQKARMIQMSQQELH